MRYSQFKNTFLKEKKRKNTGHQIPVDVSYRFWPKVSPGSGNNEGEIYRDPGAIKSTMSPPKPTPAL
jgi:hypothetical protein